MTKCKDDIFCREPQLIPCRVYNDRRGWFYEAFNQKSLDFVVNFIQDNHSFSELKGTIRGLHFQKPPFEQAKLIRVIKGKVIDVIVDLRPFSKNYLKPKLYVLDNIKKDSLFIPKGFAHGFMTLEDHTEVYYKVDEVYSKEHEVTIIFDDIDLAIPWTYCSDIILSEKDSNGVTLKEAVQILKELRI